MASINKRRERGRRRGESWDLGKLDEDLPHGT
jgi:hypothetical protein